MKILHLYANHKWTGPAELALQQVRALNQYPNVRADLALAGHHDPNRPHAIEMRAQELGVPLQRGLALRRHFHLRAHLADARRLAGWLDAGDYDLVHCHQSGDHLVAALAQWKSSRNVPLVRSYWENTPPGLGPRSWLCFKRTDRVIAAFETQGRNLARRLKLNQQRIEVRPPILGTVNLPEDRADARRRLRAELKLASGTFLIGLTARIQPQRRWDLCWEVMARLAERYPEMHLCILGRADKGVFERLCARPLAQMGLSRQAHFLGYREGRAYFDALAAFDAFLFLVPGSDATCRALREAMASGLPAVVTDLGHLSEIVQNQVTGCVREPNPEALAAALGVLHDDLGLRERLGRQAQEFASQHWRSAQCADDLYGLYTKLVARAAPTPF